MKLPLNWDVTVIVTALAVCPLLAVAGCSSFLHWSDPNVQAVSCAVGGALLPEIEALAIALGIPPSVAADIFSGACMAAAEKGATQEEAREAGLAPMRRAVAARRARGVQ